MRGSKKEVRSGVWRLRVVRGYTVTGQPIQTCRTVHGTSREADKELAKLVTQIEEDAAPTSGRLTFGDYLTKHYLPHIHDNLGPETYRNHKSKIEGRISSDLGRHRLDRLTAAHLDAAYRSWQGDIAGSTIKAHHLVISSALSQAMKWGLIPRSVAPLATLPRVERRADTTPTIDQIRRLVDEAEATDPVLGAAIMLAALTGCRRGELLGLRWSDVDRTKMLITVGRAVKRAESGERIIGPTKTHTTRRLAIDGATLAVLDTHLGRCQQWAAAGGTEVGPDAYLLTWSDPSGSTPANPDVLTTRFARLAEKVGCPEVRFHDLRHAVATTLLAAGTDVATVAGRLGHSSPVVTMRVYAHALEQADRQAAGVMGALLAATKAS